MYHSCERLAFSLAFATTPPPLLALLLDPQLQPSLALDLLLSLKFSKQRNSSIIEEEEEEAEAEIDIEGGSSFLHLLVTEEIEGGSLFHSILTINTTAASTEVFSLEPKK